MNAIEPNRSGAQINRFCWCVSRAAFIALNVLRLNSSVPTDCTEAAHQSIRCGCHARYRRRPLRSRVAWGVALIVCRYCRYPADVKKSDPTKYVNPTADAPVASA
jgi:hypothetical protein